MKNFDDFLEFLNTDCFLDMSQIGNDFAAQFTDADMLATGLPPENVGKLIEMACFAANRTTLMYLRRYHEWLTEFPNTSQPSDRQ